jgi:4-amino-4-deoxy-L-arabinose transferase-like glycosyltransferase
MFQRFDHRLGHYLLLTAVWAVLCLPNLGGPSLWDVDEGKNSGCSYEMLEANNWVVPTFNYELREDKPPLLYWLQLAGYALFGVGEFAARLPSALAALLTVLALYELGRRTFGTSTALLAGLMLAASVAFCGAAHFANPDALLNALSLLSLLAFWAAYRHDGRSWWIWGALWTALAVLAKGPVGLLLPAAVVVFFLFWQRDLKRLLDRRLLLGTLVFVAVAAPWYVWVGLETHGQWLKGFWTIHNQNRFLSPMESHGGPIIYYLVVLVVGLAPWSIFAGVTIRHCVQTLRDPGSTERAAVRFLLCWFFVYLTFFSLAGTKLPNYILPLYPAAVLLTARFLDQWRRGLVHPPAWVMTFGLTCLGLMGIGLTVALLIVGGVLPVSFARIRLLPGLASWAWLGILPIAGAVAAWWLGRGEQRSRFVTTLIVYSVAFVGLIAALAGASVEQYKAPRALASALPADQLHREVRIAALQYSQPSLVFYCRREVACLSTEQQAIDFLRSPLPAYLVTPIESWDRLRPQTGRSCWVLERRYDLYAGQDVVLISNKKE